MSQQAIVEQILTTALEGICTEVGELLGQGLATSDLQFSQVDKSAYFFDQARGKSILTRLTVSGDAEGEAYSVLPVSASIQLGANLIMLPEDSIAELVQAETLKGEEADAFSEIANILTGSLSRTFQERYPKKIHLTKGESEEIIPTKVNPDDDTPFPPSSYLLCSSDLQLEGKSLGPLDFLFPAELLGLEASAPAPVHEKEEAPAAQTSDTVDASVEEGTPADADEVAAAPAEEPAAAPSGPSPEEVKRNKSIVDLVLKSAIQKVDSELGALMGEFVATADTELKLVTKEGYFFDQPRGTLIFSQLDTSGDQNGTSFIVAELKDAVFLGGKLIMLPDEEVQAQIDTDAFDGEPADAYGEIANILTGVLCAAFEEKHPGKVHFVRKEIETVISTKVDLESDQPFPAEEMYVASCSMVVGEKELGLLEFVIPAAILGISSATIAAPVVTASAGAAGDTVAGGEGAAATDAESIAAGAGTTATGSDSVAANAASSGESASAAVSQASLPPALLVVSDNTDEAERYCEAIASLGFPCVKRSYQDDLKATLRENAVQLIYLVMSAVNEQGFATAIKLQSAAHPMPPMIACGPEWTRSAVLRAVRYGVRDILITPADDTEILAKGEGLMAQKAAG